MAVMTALRVIVLIHPVWSNALKEKQEGSVMSLRTGRLTCVFAFMLIAVGCASSQTQVNKAFESAREEADNCASEQPQSYYKQALCIEVAYKSIVPADYEQWSQLNQTLAYTMKLGRYADQTHMSRKDFDAGMKQLWQDSPADQAAYFKQLEAERSKALDEYIEQHNKGGNPASTSNSGS